MLDFGYLGDCAWWLGEVGSGLEGGAAAWLPRGRRGGVSLDEGGGTADVGVATTAACVGVAAGWDGGDRAKGAKGAEGASDPLLLVSLNPRVIVLNTKIFF
jgi:hypothetical protein